MEKDRAGFFKLVKTDAKRWNPDGGFLSFAAMLFFQPGFQLSLSIRLQQSLKKIPLAGNLLCKIVWYLTCIAFGCYCSHRADYGEGLYFPHPCGLVIGDGVRIGDNVTIYQCTTLGLKGVTDIAYPSVGNDAVIYAGAQILGPLRIGARAVVGANAVVTKDVPENATAAGVPARIIA